MKIKVLTGWSNAIDSKVDEWSDAHPNINVVSVSIGSSMPSEPAPGNTINAMVTVAIVYEIQSQPEVVQR